jgi:hypothetical protein
MAEQTIDPRLIDVVLPEHDGYPEEMMAEDTHDVLFDICGSASREFPQALWIEPRDWPDKAAENDKYKTWPLDYIDRFTNQSPTHECTCHSLRAIAEACWNRQRSIAVGPPVVGQFPAASAQSASVWFSCLSIYAEANPRIRGGASVRGVLDIAIRRGFLPELKQPKDWGFKHAITGTQGKGNVTQSNGAWVPVGQFPQGWQETARHFKPLEVIFPTRWEQVVCLVLHGYSVGVGRSGHAIPYVKWVNNGGKWIMAYLDSYDVIRYDSRPATGGAFAIASMTTPNSWDRPAGDDHR